MGIITLPNKRVCSDIRFRVRLKDGGMYVDWSDLTGIRAYLYSDDQKALAGRCDVSVDGEDGTVLVCEYAATKPQYPGVNSIIVRARYMGREKVYDKRAVNLVPRTFEASGSVILQDPVVDVELVVEDVSSSILDNILAACIRATEEARGIADVSRGPRGFSAYEVACQNGYVGSEQEWLESLVGPAGKSAYQLAVDQGYDGTLAEWLASLKGQAGDSAYQIAVEEGFLGTKSQWLASLVGPQGLSAYQVAVVEGFEGSVSEWLASLVGPPGVTSCVITVDDTTSETPSATASVLNGVLTIHISGIKGNPGVGLDSISTNEDGTVDVLLTDGNVISVNLNHDHPAYLKYKLCEDEQEYRDIAVKDPTTLYLIKEEE